MHRKIWEIITMPEKEKGGKKSILLYCLAYEFPKLSSIEFIYNNISRAILHFHTQASRSYPTFSNFLATLLSYIFSFPAPRLPLSPIILKFLI